MSHDVGDLSFLRNGKDRPSAGEVLIQLSWNRYGVTGLEQQQCRRRTHRPQALRARHARHHLYNLFESEIGLPEYETLAGNLARKL